MNQEKYICHRCIAENYVSNFIKEIGKANRNCNYCGTRNKNVELSVIAEMLHKMFTENYAQPEDGEFYYNNSESGGFIIQEELQVDDEPASDLLGVMADIYNDYHDSDITYDESFHYVRGRRSYNSLGYAWQKMEESLKSEARYFNQHVKNFLDDVFSDIEQLKINKSQNAIYEVDSEIIIYRARAFENYEDVEKALEHPERYFGPPPHELARSGRMNAHGIPVFYGATSPKIAVAEVRPVVGNFIVVVPFRPLRALKLLDISALDRLRPVKGSLFDPHVKELNEKASFMRTLSRKLTLPVSGKNPENDYLITQAISEYLSVSKEYQLDGISFNSTQYSKTDEPDARYQNVVLFRGASKIKDSVNQHKSYLVELFEHIEDNEYGFSPKIRQIMSDEKNKHSFSYLSSEKQQYALELMLDGIVFYKIQGVSYETVATTVDLLDPLYSQGTSISSGPEEEDF